MGGELIGVQKVRKDSKSRAPAMSTFKAINEALS